jgi:hypothetical protein
MIIVEHARAVSDHPSVGIAPCGLRLFIWTEDVPACRSARSGVGGRMLRPLRRSRAGRRGNLHAWRRGPGAQLAIRGASGCGVGEANAVCI